MERIARAARCNKAMLFYYFTSKEKLYHAVLAQALGQIFSEIDTVLREPLTPERFLEKFPEIYIRFLARNPDLPRILVFDLVHNPKSIAAAVGGVFRENSGRLPDRLLALIRSWHGQGLVREGDPLQFMLNVVSLSIFSFVARPLVEAISGMRAADDDEFQGRRIASVAGLLKRGMLQ